MAFNTKEQAIIDWGTQNGKSVEEIKQAVFRYRTTGSPVDPSIEQKPQPSFLERVSSRVEEDLTTRADRFGQILQRDTGPAEKGLQLFGQGAGLAAQTLETAVEEIPGVKRALGAFGAGINWLAASEFSPVKKLGDVIGGTKAVQEAVNLYDTDADFKDTVDAVANTARLGFDIQTIVDSANFTTKVTNKLADKAKSIVPPGGGGGGFLRGALGEGKNLLERAKSYLGGKQVEPTLKISATRLAQEGGFAEETIISRQGIGKTQLESPLKTYNKFAEQEAAFRGDIMQDPALGIVGERVGDAFEQVIKLRQDIGATIGNEIKTVGKLKTNTNLAQEQFRKNLVEQGLKIDKGILSQTKLSKLTGDDVSLLQEYIAELNKLSKTPTLAELDAFLSRLPKELEVYKSKNNIIKVTNGERLIKENLSQLRRSASPEINPKFKNYFNAKGLYSDLSNFIEEGSSFLGKKTQTGDFAKDASLAKSSVQSILNQGKKDWLARLEGLTGYPALDETVLALQAMKDAGNSRGLSLLEKINENRLPVTKYGIAGKIGEFAIEKGKEFILGSEAEQTRAFLKSLEEEIKL